MKTVQNNYTDDKTKPKFPFWIVIFSALGNFSFLIHSKFNPSQIASFWASLITHPGVWPDVMDMDIWFEMIEKEEWLCCVCLNRVRNRGSGNRDTGRKFLRIASFLYSKLGYLLASKDFIRKPLKVKNMSSWESF